MASSFGLKSHHFQRKEEEHEGKKSPESKKNLPQGLSQRAPKQDEDQAQNGGGGIETRYRGDGRHVAVDDCLRLTGRYQLAIFTTL